MPAAGRQFNPRDFTAKALVTKDLGIHLISIYKKQIYLIMMNNQHIHMLRILIFTFCSATIKLHLVIRS